MHVSEEIQKLIPYKPGKPIDETQREYGLGKVCKLASNENPLWVSAKVTEALHEALGELHRYPDAQFYHLRKVVGEFYGIEGNRLSFGNGSNEVIDLLIRLFCENGQTLVTSSAAFVAYKVCAQASRVRVVEVPIGEDLRFDLKAMGDRVEAMTEPPRLVFIANPNNPTGTYVSSDELEAFLQRSRSWQNTFVVIDEAYNEFVRAEDYPKSRKLLDSYENLILIRTFSKVYGLAGLRVGALLARPEVIDYYDRIRNPFNVNSLAQVAVIAALSDLSFLEQSQQMNWQGLDYFYKELTALGIPFWRSQANFVLLDTGRDAGLVYEQLLQKGVILRPVKGYGLPQHLRMSVGRPEENEWAIQALKEVLG